MRGVGVGVSFDVVQIGGRGREEGVQWGGAACTWLLSSCLTQMKARKRGRCAGYEEPLLFEVTFDTVFHSFLLQSFVHNCSFFLFLSC